MTTAEHIRVGVRHPLEPLTAEEIETVSQILTRDRGLADSARFVYVTLREPPKDAVLRHQPGEAFEREAHVVLRERAEYKTLRRWSRSRPARCGCGARCPVSS